MNAKRDSSLHDSVWEGVKHAIDRMERFDDAWPMGCPIPLAVIADASFRVALRRDLAWAGQATREA